MAVVLFGVPEMSFNKLGTTLRTVLSKRFQLIMKVPGADLGF